MKISVITSLYYGKKYVKRLINMIYRNSVLLGDKAQLEYIFVNDSPDETIVQSDIDEITQQLDITNKAMGSFKIKLLVNDRNRGIHYSRVHGLKEAEGDYILFFDQDDELSEKALATFYEEACKTPQTDVIVAGGYRKYTDKKELLYSKKTIIRHIGDEKMYLYGTDLIFSPGQCLIKKSAITSVWMEQILEVNGCDDFLLWLLMLNCNCKFRGIATPLYYHIETEDNYSGSFENMQKSYTAVCELLKQIDSYPQDKLSVLIRRGELKSVMKSTQSKFKKCKQVIKNLDIIISILKYKMYGYH